MTNTLPCICVLVNTLFSENVWDNFAKAVRGAKSVDEARACDLP
jgi:hypothetical protein